ncbi:MAG: DUF5711 family protein [Eubacterium sp.]|nr:DUF5711 family protein [Eubacterium sp.]
MNKKTILIAVGIVVVIIAAFYITGRLRTYTDYTVISSVDHDYEKKTECAAFGDLLLIYGTDGITCTDTDDELMWSQSYEIDQPLLAQCGEYAAVAEEDGGRVYIFNTEGYVDQIDLSHRILQISVAEDGTVAVALEKENAYLLDVYSADGELKAEGEIHIDNYGYPLSIALSDDGDNLAVSFLTVASGNSTSTVNFYNFGTEGSAQEDNIVASYTYDNRIIAKIESMGDDWVAFSDSDIYVYKGATAPAEDADIVLEDEALSVFSSDDAFGYVCENPAAAEESADEEEGQYLLRVYKSSGKLKYEKDFALDYNEVYLMSNGEVSIVGDSNLEIISNSGRSKFTYSFDSSIMLILSGGKTQNYTFVLEDSTQKVRLK